LWLQNLRLGQEIATQQVHAVAADVVVNDLNKFMKKWKTIHNILDLDSPQSP
jgi:hypothetical protein